MTKLILIDGMALAYRGHFALIKNPRISSSGMNTSCCFVFTNVLLELLKNENPSHIAVVFDTKEPTFRHKEYPAYKAQRDEMPEDLATAIPYIKKICEGFNIPVITAPGWEADDIIGTLAKQSESTVSEVAMVTPDKDFAQLVSEKIIQYKPSRTGSGYEKMGIPQILEKWGIIRIDQVIDILGLMGDSSDNIPGIPGIGPKTAEKLINDFDSIEGVLANTDKLKGKQKEKVEENKELALLSKRLVTIHTDVPLNIKWEDLVIQEFDKEKLQVVLQELEFKSILSKVFGDKLQPQETKLRSLKNSKYEYILADSAEKRNHLIDTLIASTSVCFDCETTGLDYKICDIVGIAFATEKNKAYYVPFPTQRKESEKLLQEFRIFFQNPVIEKIGHNLKYDLSVLRWHGIHVNGPFFDTMIACHLTLPESRKSMDFLAENLLEYQCIPITDLIGPKGKDQGNMRNVPLNQACEYACEDVDITL
jgi:DNA polymerase-1